LGINAPTPSDVIALSGGQGGLSSIVSAPVGRGRPLPIEAPSYWGAILAARNAGVKLVPVPSGPGGPAPEILDVVRKHGAFMVEDDWAHEVGIDSDPVAARDDSGHVIYVRSLAKSVSPAIRMAAVVARGPARERTSPTGSRGHVRQRAPAGARPGRGHLAGDRRIVAASATSSGPALT